MAFHWNLHDSKSLQVTGTLLSILVFSLCTNPLVTTTVTSMFFNSLTRSRHLHLFSSSFSFRLFSARTAKFTIRQILLFVCFLQSLGRLVRPRFDDRFVSQNPTEFRAIRFPGWIPGCAYTICSYGQIKTSCTIPSGSPCHSALSSLILSLH